MSNINANAINTTYPVAGQDNDSQGFRDNFTAIQAGLATAKSEITTLQSNSVLVADLATSTTPVVNNLLGSTISNGIFLQFNGQAVGNIPVNSTGATVNINSGPIQQFTLSAGAVLTITGWPVSGLWSVIRLILKGDGLASYIATIQGTNHTGSNSTIKVPTSGWSGSTTSTTAQQTLDTTHYEIIEAWSVNGGTTVFLKNVGEY